MIRGLTSFKAIAGTRYYIKLIITSLDSIKYFLVLFFYSTFFFSVIIAIAQNDQFDFNTLWDQSWNLNFGGDIENKEDTLVYLTILIAKVINVVLMLNMLISILGDCFENFLLEKHIIDYREKLEFTIEIQKMMYFFRSENLKNYFHFLMPAFEDDADGSDWQGKILYLEKRQERKILQLGEKIAYLEKNNGSSLKNVENKISGVEDKISAVENKISSVENRISEVENKISAEIAGVENKISTGVAGVENKISAEISRVENKLNKMESDLERIIQLLTRD